MFCFFCKNPESEVIETRVTEDGLAVRRRRSCPKCEKRFTTYERAEEMPIFVLKRDGRREKFAPVKLKEGIIKGVGKAKVSMEQIDEVVNSVSNKISASQKSEFTTEEIGELVLEYLKNMNGVAYIRFASVFKRFNSVEEFKNEFKNFN